MKKDIDPPKSSFHKQSSSKRMDMLSQSNQRKDKPRYSKRGLQESSKSKSQSRSSDHLKSSSRHSSHNRSSSNENGTSCEKPYRLLGRAKSPSRRRRRSGDKSRDDRRSKSRPRSIEDRSLLRSSRGLNKNSNHRRPSERRMRSSSKDILMSQHPADSDPDPTDQEAMKSAFGTSCGELRGNELSLAQAILAAKKSDAAKRAASPGRLRGRSPGKSRSRSPGAHRHKSPGRHRDEQSPRRHPSTPGKYRSTSPGKFRSKSPGRYRATSPGKYYQQPSVAEEIVRRTRSVSTERISLLLSGQPKSTKNVVIEKRKSIRNGLGLQANPTSSSTQFRRATMQTRKPSSRKQYSESEHSGLPSRSKSADELHVPASLQLSRLSTQKILRQGKSFKPKDTGLQVSGDSNHSTCSFASFGENDDDTETINDRKSSGRKSSNRQTTATPKRWLTKSKSCEGSELRPAPVTRTTSSGKLNDDLRKKFEANQGGNFEWMNFFG